MPLPELLVTEYEDGGLDALTRTYRSARSRYYEADAYDFRIDTLIDVANQLADMGEFVSCDTRVAPKDSTSMSSSSHLSFAT